MKILSLIILAVVLAGFSPALAHDIGISQATLIEQDSFRYVLSVQARPALGFLFSPPVLPESCRFLGHPRGAQGTAHRRFEFICEKALTADDSLLLPWRRDGTMLTAKWRDGSESKGLFRREGRHISIPLAQLQVGSGSWVDAARRYVNLGIEHILIGIDHLLFVLALLLIVRGPWMLVKTVSAFTVAHSLTLGLATMGYIHVPTRPVEASIALSIVFLCVEIVHAHQGRVGLTYRYPWVVALAFGLLHGLGFAGALSEVGLPPQEIPVALLFFNIGVEIGQLLFVAVVMAVWFCMTWTFRRLGVVPRAWARALPVYTIGTVASYWFIQRVTAMLPTS